MTGGNGFTPFTSASTTRHADVVRLLLGHGGKLDVKTSMGATALTLASGSGHMEVMKVFLEAAAATVEYPVYCNCSHSIGYVHHFLFLGCAHRRRVS